MSAFLNQFEFIMRKAEVGRREWGSKLVSKLSPKLCEGVRPRLELKRDTRN